MVAELLMDIPLPEEQRVAKLGIIRRTVARAHCLVLDLLDVARLQAGEGIPVRTAPIPCTELVREAMEIIQVQAAEKRQQVTWSVAEGSGSVLADRDRILQVFANLMGNAVKFTPEGGSIEIRAQPDAAEICFRVTDTGPGVPPADLPNLFEPFWQARETASLGTGLGLTVAKAIVEAHGGRIFASSAPGHGGATFRSRCRARSSPERLANPSPGVVPAARRPPHSSRADSGEMKVNGEETRWWSGRRSRRRAARVMRTSSG